MENSDAIYVIDQLDAPTDDDSLGRCRSLRYVSSYMPGRNHVPEWVSRCTSLETLILDETIIESDEWPHAMTLTLKQIVISGGSGLPSHIGWLTRLEILDVSNTAISTAPFDMMLPANLHTLSLSFCDMARMMCDISGLVNLKELDLSNNHFAEVPQGLSSLTALTHLALDFNELSVFPIELCTLTRLVTLNLASNPLGHFPTVIHEALTNLKDLCLFDCGITCIPSLFFGNMTQLCTLDLRLNDLSSSTGVLWHFPSLEKLTLAACNLTTLPKLSTETNKLKVVDIADNNVGCMTRDFMKLTQYDLKRLDLRGIPPYTITRCAPMCFIYRELTIPGMFPEGISYHEVVGDLGRVCFGVHGYWIERSLDDYTVHCVHQIMLMTQYIKQEQQTNEDVFIDGTAILYNIGTHIASIFQVICMQAIESQWK